MFDIEYKGATTIIITTKKVKLITDPVLSYVGLKDAPVKGCVELATEERFVTNNADPIVSIDGPGEYEVSNFSIRGIAVTRHIDSAQEGKQGTMYRIEVDDVKIAFIGHIDDKLDEDQLEMLGVVDIVIIPVGGRGYTLDAAQATKLVRKIDAKLIVPMHYADSQMKYEVPQDDLEIFEKEFGGQVERQSKLKIKSAASLPSVPTVCVVQRT